MPSSNPAQQRVLIIGEGSLLDESVTQLLTDGHELLVSRATYSDDLAFLNAMKLGEPNVIVISDSGALETARLLDLVSAYPLAPGLRIVVVRMNNNVIDVYARPVFMAGMMSSRPRKVIVRAGGDLINAVTRKQRGQRAAKIQMSQ